MKEFKLTKQQRQKLAQRRTLATANKEREVKVAVKGAKLQAYQDIKNHGIVYAWESFKLALLRDTYGRYTVPIAIGDDLLVTSKLATGKQMHRFIADFS